MTALLRGRDWADAGDTTAMRTLVAGRLGADWPATRLHPGDVDWWETAEHGRGRTLDAVVRLWHDDAGLAAYAWFGAPTDLDVITRHDVPVAAVAADAFTWAETRAASAGPPGGGATRPRIAAWARDDGEEATAYAGLGLVPGDVRFVHFTGEVAGLDLAPVGLPPDLAERTLTEADVASRAACGRAAFHSTMTPERYAFARTRPSYRPELDTLLVDADGAVAAFALGWLDDASGVLELEPVGVHPDRHRRGLGRAVCRAAIRRGAALGATRVVIGAEAANPGAMGLYADLGLRVTVRFVAYSR
jgi:mycothiol synthase